MYSEHCAKDRHWDRPHRGNEDVVHPWTIICWKIVDVTRSKNKAMAWSGCGARRLHRLKWNKPRHGLRAASTVGFLAITRERAKLTCLHRWKERRTDYLYVRTTPSQKAGACSTYVYNCRTKPLSYEPPTEKIQRGRGRRRLANRYDYQARILLANNKVSSHRNAEKKRQLEFEYKSDDRAAKTKRPLIRLYLQQRSPRPQEFSSSSPRLRLQSDHRLSPRVLSRPCRRLEWRRRPTPYP